MIQSVLTNSYSNNLYKNLFIDLIYIQLHVQVDKYMYTGCLIQSNVYKERIDFIIL